MPKPIASRLPMYGSVGITVLFFLLFYFFDCFFKGVCLNSPKIRHEIQPSFVT
ncbi:hypothetical protein RER_25200 [Rhodococcus erythropolis PR4]|uniref:Uncharacterized protein n=1 Tax=Rhodococcus erythropolis (strain PR4 / NBRC 100887) TaxID=234621 RepID=C0ZXZ3_RHOE4|nr:hypothetical protein RER_25200 [Rhodococcus erythropolis PR4]